MTSRVWVIEAPGKKEAFTRALVESGFPEDRVLATFGRLYDLPEEKLGFDPDIIADPEKPTEISWSPRRRDQVVKLLDWLSDADEVIIATDSDLEGELIASQVEGLCLRAKSKYGKPGKVSRAHVRGFTSDYINKALNSRTHLCANTVRAAKARRVLDRLLGYRLHSDADPWRLSIGRVTTPLVSSLFQSPAHAAIIRKKLDGGWNAILRLRADEAGDSEKIISALHGLPSPGLASLSRVSMTHEHKPLTGPDALKLCMRSIAAKPAEVQAAIQRTYEKGKVSYPRSDSRTLDEVGRKWVQRMASANGIDCDTRILGLRESEVLERSYDAHGAVIPLVDDISGDSIADSFLSIEESVLRVIYNHSLRMGEEAEVFYREHGELNPGDGVNDKWLSVLRPWLGSLTFVRDTDHLGMHQDPLRIEFNRSPDTHANLISSWAISPQQQAMERLMELSIGRPSTLLSISEKAFTGYLDRYGKVNGRGRIMLEKMMRRVPELLDPDVARTLEDVVTDTKEQISIGERLSRAWRVLNHNPLLRGDVDPAIHQAPTVEQNNDIPVKHKKMTKEAAFKHY